MNLGYCYYSYGITIFPKQRRPLQLVSHKLRLKYRWEAQSEFATAEKSKVYSETYLRALKSYHVIEMNSAAVTVDDTGTVSTFDVTVRTSIDRSHINALFKGWSRHFLIEVISQSVKIVTIADQFAVSG